MRTILASGAVSEDDWPHLNRAFAESSIEMLARLLDEHPAGPERTLALSRMREVAEAVEASGTVKAWLRG